MRTVAIIPALDEEESIGAVVEALSPRVDEVIVVDNGSRDRTATAAAAAGARVVTEPRRGYGRACLAGLAAARADVFVFLDGDGSDDPEQLPAVVGPLIASHADLVIGSRRLGPRERGSHPWHAVFGTRLCVALMNGLVGSRASDLGPFRAVSAEALRRIGMQDEDYGWTVEMQVKAARLGLRVVEVPVAHRVRRAGRSKVSGTLRGSVLAGAKIVTTILRHGGGGRLGVAAAAAVLSACVLAWTSGPPPTDRIGAHLAWFGAAFAAYLVALACSRDLSRRGLALALGVALVWRALLVAAPPLLSDDVNRYVWEGRVQVHGGNPYRWADRPQAEKWVPLRDDVWQGLNHKQYTAVYPPLFVLTCRAVASVGDSLTAMKAFLVACEVATLGLLALLLRRRRLPQERLLVLAWSPLALLEIAGSGHNEAFAVVFLVLGLVALDANRPLLSALAAGAGFMSKYLPGLVAAAWVRRYRWWHVLAAGVFSGLLVVPYLGGRRTMLLSLSKYSEYWTFNETLFAPLAAVLGSHQAAVRLGALATLGLALVLGWRRAEPVAAATAVVVASLVLSPNVLPWYALWLPPLLVLRDEPAALLFTGTVSLAYLVYPGWQSGEPWKLAWGWRALEYGPCALVALAGLQRDRLRRRRVVPSSG